MNIREARKESRLRRIRAIISMASKEGKKIDIEKTISILIVEENVSRRTALEEINAVLNYDAQ